MRKRSLMRLTIQMIARKGQTSRTVEREWMKEVRKRRKREWNNLTRTNLHPQDPSRVVYQTASVELVSNNLEVGWVISSRET